jgi:hypothetical protein
MQDMMGTPQDLGNFQCQFPQMFVASAYGRHYDVERNQENVHFLSFLTECSGFYFFTVASVLGITGFLHKLGVSLPKVFFLLDSFGDPEIANQAFEIKAFPFAAAVVFAPHFTPNDIMEFSFTFLV